MRPTICVSGTACLSSKTACNATMPKNRQRLPTAKPCPLHAGLGAARPPAATAKKDRTAKNRRKPTAAQPPEHATRRPPRGVGERATCLCAASSLAASPHLRKTLWPRRQRNPRESPRPSRRHGQAAVQATGAALAARRRPRRPGRAFPAPPRGRTKRVPSAAPADRRPPQPPRHPPSGAAAGAPNTKEPHLPPQREPKS